MAAILKALWAYRGFIFGSVRREFQSRYQNSLLGAAWTVLTCRRASLAARETAESRGESCAARRRSM